MNPLLTFTITLSLLTIGLSVAMGAHEISARVSDAIREGCAPKKWDAEGTLIGLGKWTNDHVSIGSKELSTSNGVYMSQTPPPIISHTESGKWIVGRSYCIAENRELVKCK